ncbi:ABC transporter ATP-binding protein [Paraburkholderia phenoliruptrix]|uniref:ABC transporter ATP-binding protein n=1 Tax=Paraburkholderia phenoliruptrix TaxID=252970 RepID=UPI001C4F643A|nr:ABC transporter ATP-binding protein [Paraburkholderia phenoliruptrix]MBW0447713.1 ABC transporter ATP-binding protein [Paraburkholderia phenoliruptrix]MBW9098505.1 ABC transporter ATP-binding protein [Paraburkholderia phenoliruptrix]
MTHDVQTLPATLQLTDVSVSYRTRGADIHALHEVSVSVGAGEFVSILGPSGCGKSTLLKVAAGLLQPTRGEIAFHDTRAARADVGVAFQKPLLLPWKSVRENVLLPLRAAGLPVERYQARCNQLLDTMGLAAFAGNYPRELSGGMQQRVALARMLIADPSVLLMDEPFSALDAMTREALSLELQRIWIADRKSVLFITHSIAEAVFLSDRVLVMSARPGRIVESLDIDLPRPRTLDTMTAPAFVDACNHLRQRFIQ